MFIPSLDSFFLSSVALQALQYNFTILVQI